MKVCGTCGKTFGDEMLFCLDDGTMLREQTATFAATMTEEQTVIKAAPKATGSSKMVLVALGGFLILGFLLITAAVIGGFWYYSSLPERTVAQAESPATPTPEFIDEYYPTPDALPTTSPTPNSGDEKPPPIPAKTPKPEPSKKPTCRTSRRRT